MPTPSRAYPEVANRFGGVDPSDTLAVDKFYARFGDLPTDRQDQIIEALLERDGEQETEVVTREYAEEVPVPRLSEDRDLETMADLGAPGELDREVNDELDMEGKRLQIGSPAKTRGLLVVSSKVRELIKEKKMNARETAVEALSKAVEDLVKKACQRAAKDHRKTVEAEDVSLPPDRE